VADHDESPGDRTIATYEAGVERYRSHLPDEVPAPVRAFLEEVAECVGPGSRVLELGSGPGREAAYLETRGVNVTRSDATAAFVAMMRRDGHDARLLDVRRDELGTGWDAVLADAMLLHLTREEFRSVVAKARRAVRDGGLLAITLKEGDREGWSTAKLDAPRWFTYWREAPLRQTLEDAGWRVRSVDHVPGRVDEWLYVIARTA